MKNLTLWFVFGTCFILCIYLFQQKQFVMGLVVFFGSIPMGWVLSGLTEDK
jgi:hypothetical protein